MTVSEVIKGRYHLISSDESVTIDALTELLDYIDKNKINPIKVVKVADTWMIYYN